MNIERGITYIATLIMALIVLAYTFGLQNWVPSFVFSKQATVSVETSRMPAEVTSKDEVADLRELAEYQERLSTYTVNPTRAAKSKDKPVEQIADLRELAVYQASLPTLFVPKTTQQRQGVVDQIANLRELDQFQETYTRYFMDLPLQ